MHAQTKYKSEMKTAVLGDRTITIKNLTPILPPRRNGKSAGARWNNSFLTCSANMPDSGGSQRHPC